MFVSSSVVSRVMASIGALILLSGCAQNYYKPITAEIKPNTAAEVELLIEQHEINKDIVVSNASAGAAAGGFIGALIVASIDVAVNNGRAEDAEEQVKPIRDALVDFDADQVAKTAFERAFKNSATFAVSKVNVLKTKDETKETLKNLDVPYAITSLVKYSLSADASMLNVSVDAGLYVKDDSLYHKHTGKSAREYDITKLKLQDSLYKNRINLTAKVDELSVSSEAVKLKYWKKDNAAELRRLISFSINKAAEFLAEDMNVVSGEPKKMSYSTIITKHGSKVKGVILSEDDNFQMIKTSAGIINVYL